MESESNMIIEALKSGMGDQLFKQDTSRCPKNKDNAMDVINNVAQQYDDQKNYGLVDSSFRAHIWKNLTLGIACSPDNSIYMGYVERSYLFYDMHKFEESARDADRALQIIEDDYWAIEMYVQKIKCYKELRDDDRVEDTLSDAQAYIKKISKNYSRSEYKKLMKLKASINAAKKYEATSAIKTKDNRRALFMEELKRRENDDPFDNLDISYDQKDGRHLIAKKEFKPGDIICVQKPYTSCSNIENSPYAYCCHCMDICQDSVACKQCDWFMYCSEKCRDEAEKQYHDVECDVVPGILSPGNIDVFKHLTTRVVILAIREYGSLCDLKKEMETIFDSADIRTKGFTNGKFDGSRFKSIINLTPSASESYVDYCLYDSLHIFLAFINGITVSGVKKYKSIPDILNDEDMIFLAALIFKLLKILRANYSAVFEKNYFCDDGSASDKCSRVNCCYRGITITPLFAFLNHSCVPNVLLNFTDAKNVVLSALRPIKPGEQLFTSYSPKYYMVDKIRRNAQLQRNFNFTCTCKACVENWPTDEELPNKTTDFKLPGVKDEDRISDSHLTAMLRLAEMTIIDIESHNSDRLNRLGTAITQVLKNFAEPCYLICRLLKAFETVSRSIFLNELRVELSKEIPE